MKVIVQVPCLNEEATLPLVLNSIPKKIKGVDSIEVLIIDDGSSDKTVAVAKKHGVTHFVLHSQRKGLARSFHDGLLKGLELGADIIVNTDVHDAPSGFRAYSRDAAMQLNVVTRFSYAMETFIQAGNKNMRIVNVPITTNPKTRESRLFKSPWEHICKSGSAIIRAFVMYRPVGLFVSVGVAMLIFGLIPFGRFLYFVTFESGRGHIQSLIIGSVLLIAAFISFALGVIADLIRINRI